MASAANDPMIRNIYVLWDYKAIFPWYFKHETNLIREPLWFSSSRCHLSAPQWVRAAVVPSAAAGQPPLLLRHLHRTGRRRRSPSNKSEEFWSILYLSLYISKVNTLTSNNFSYVVPQLCAAGEEEFLEIMALVGMASKPLHVRRLQKALQDWVQNPGMSGKTSFLGQRSNFDWKFLIFYWEVGHIPSFDRLWDTQECGFMLTVTSTPMRLIIGRKRVH